ncbi:unnamed protein product [Rotaria magnacalcarata]|uniref:Uncharacterized protein n=4 Tax=Rotaria magnacalcarata TaxID=392030 RepID=A0A816PRS3_9BILA|nr:unnamed protein product [Rotaria magnacalcarata]CAF1396675.1 unnamed protein product [Rotaria magnacalcarata]CAF2050956.1 unnamed protein product [Rotaria magnacalcarata]CAF4063225.1 unnamed protein product [Rotaria magnacalcarata]CAF4979139.1 unnamed protein product [Rotaria magnacalcarata]
MATAPATIPPIASATMHSTVPPIVPPSVSNWRQKFPASLSGTISFLQIVLTIIIIGCEIGSILIDIITVTIYVGLWAGLFFLVASLSQSGSSCCCRERGCAKFALVSQCLALFFSLCVIGFDAYFLMNTSACFFTTSACNSTGLSRGLFYSTSNFNNIKIPLIDGQLGAGCAMFVLCLIQIIIYIRTAFVVNQIKNSPTIHPIVPSSLPVLPTGADGMIIAPPIMNVRAHRAGSPLYHRPTMVIDNGDGRANDLTCPTCTTTMSVTVRKKIAGVYST